MTSAPGVRDPRVLFIGAGLGVYAAMVALAPSLPAKLFLCAPLVAIPLLWRLLSSATAWVALFLGCALLAPPLPVAIGDSGPHIALLFAAAGLFVGMLRLPDWRFQDDTVAVALLSLAAILMGSIAMAALYSGIQIAVASLARVLLFAITVYLYLYVRSGPGDMAPSTELRFIRFLFWAAVLSALFACVDFYFQFPAPAGYEPQFIWLSSGVFRRAQGVFYEASTLGNLCAFFLEMVAVALFRPRQAQPFSPLSLAMGGASFAAALVLSYSRASLVNVGVALAVLLWLHRKRIRWTRLLIGVTGFGGAAAALLTIVFPQFTSMYFLRISAAYQYLFESPNAVLSGRVQSWRFLIDFLASNPWHLLLGVGYKTLPYSDFIGDKAVADNVYLGLLIETGIAGLAAVIALCAAILTSAYRAHRSENPLRSFCGTWMLCFWAGQSVQMLSGDLLTYWRVLPVYFCVMAIANREKDVRDS